MRAHLWATRRAGNRGEYRGGRNVASARRLLSAFPENAVRKKRPLRRMLKVRAAGALRVPWLAPSAILGGRLLNCWVLSQTFKPAAHRGILSLVRAKSISLS